MAYSTSFVIDGINMSIEAIRQIDRIEKVDFEESSGLEMFCYKEGTDTDSATTVRQTRGVVFAGDNEGNFTAVDARTGAPLWHYPMGTSIWGAAATTYMLDGRQYVLIPSGTNLTAFALETR